MKGESGSRLARDIAAALARLGAGEVKRATLARLLAELPQSGDVELVEHHAVRTDDQRRVLVVIVRRRERHLLAATQLARRFPLTRREAQVALFLADRLTNKEIAAALGISYHTAKRHTERVLAKLGVRRRSQVAAALQAAREPERGSASDAPD